MIGVYNYTVVFTYLSVVSAVVGMYLSSCGNIKAGIFCLMFSAFCDMLDGPIARTRKNRTESEKKFGIQIDSLSDLISFGVQPAVLLFFTVKYAIGDGPILIATVVVGGFLMLDAVIRLAFFNVSEEERQHSEGNKARKSYRGLPVTCSAMTFSLAYCSKLFTTGGTYAYVLLAVMALTALFYIVDFPMFKLHGKWLVLMVLFGSCIFVGVCLA